VTKRMPAHAGDSDLGKRRLDLALQHRCNL
jgi:hypothetical protein